jgi:hypothetical protein
MKKFTLDQFWNLRRKINAKLDRYETALFLLLDKRAALLDELEPLNELLRTYTDEFHAIYRTRHTAWGNAWIAALDEELSDLKCDLEDFIWDKEAVLEELDADIEGTRFNMDNALYQL